MKEEFRDIKDYEGLYQVSNFGRVKSLARYRQIGNRACYYKEKILTAYISNGYYRLELYKNNVGINYSIHCLVAEAFIPNPQNKLTVNHEDGNKLNNFIWNLKWMTSKEQTNHSINSLENYVHGENCGTHILIEPQVIEILEKYATGNYKQTELAKEYNVNKSTIWNIIHNISWKHIKRTPPIGSPLKKPNI